MSSAVPVADPAAAAEAAAAAAAAHSMEEDAALEEEEEASKPLPSKEVPTASFRKRSKRREWRTFEACRTFAQSLNLKSQKEWKEYRKSGKRPDDVPGSPDEAYKDKGWISWGDFLGTGNNQNNKKVYREFEPCREFARTLGLRTWKEWMTWSRDSGKRPIDVPSHPDRTYKDKGWNGYRDFLGEKPRPSSGKPRKKRKKSKKEKVKEDKVQAEGAAAGGAGSGKEGEGAESATKQELDSEKGKPNDEEDPASAAGASAEVEISI